MERRILVIINRLGGRGFARRAHRVASEMLTRAGLEHEILATRSMRKIRGAAASAAERGFTEITCIGGDGTVGMVTNQVTGKDVLLSLVPGGTGNILAKHLNVPLRLRAALRVVIASEHVVDLDCIERDDRLHVLNLSIGLSSLAMTDVDGRMKRLLGTAAYFFVVLGHLARRGPARFCVVADGQVRRVRGRELLLTNAGFSKTALAPLFADSRPDDGRLELSIFHLSGGRGLLGMLYDVVLHTNRYRDRYLQRLYITESLHISSKPELPVQADGDGVGSGSVIVRLRRAAVRVRVPDPNLSIIDWAIAEISPVRAAER